MGWHTLPSYSVEEAALLAAGIDPSEVNSSVENAKGAYYPGWQDAVGWSRSISLAIEHEHIRPLNDRLFFAGSTKSQGPYVREFDHGKIIDSSKTKVSRPELRRWFALHGTTPTFLFNPEERDIFEDEGFEQAQLTFLYNETMAAENLKRAAPESEEAPPKHDQTAPAEIPAHLLEIQKLLDGEHRCQAPELLLALRAWLDLSGQADPDGKLRNGVTTEIENWLRKTAPELCKSKAFLARIGTVANWNKING